MKLPRRGDPRRPLVLAYREMRTLAVLLLLYGMWSVSRSLRAGIAPVHQVEQIILLLIVLIPGAACLVLAINLKRRKYWAVVVSLVVASFFGLDMVFVPIFLLFALRGLPGTGMTGFILWGPIVVAGLILLWLGQLIFNLARSFQAIKYLPIEQSPEISIGHGFEPIMVLPIEPAPPGTPEIIEK